MSIDLHPWSPGPKPTLPEAVRLILESAVGDLRAGLEVTGAYRDYVEGEGCQLPPSPQRKISPRWTMDDDMEGW